MWWRLHCGQRRWTTWSGRKSMRQATSGTCGIVVVKTVKFFCSKIIFSPSLHSNRNVSRLVLVHIYKMQLWNRCDDAPLVWAALRFWHAKASKFQFAEKWLSSSWSFHAPVAYTLLWLFNSSRFCTNTGMVLERAIYMCKNVTSLYAGGQNLMADILWYFLIWLPSNFDRSDFGMS